MNVLVTGAAGFIGFHVCRRLLKSDFNVVGIDNLSDYYDVSLKIDRLKQLGLDYDEKISLQDNIVLNHNNFTFCKIDLTNTEKVLNLFSEYKFDVVINLAAQAGVRYSLTNPHIYIDSNVKGFLNILEGSRNEKVNHLIYASTSSVYGLNTKMPLNVDDPCNHPMTIYAATKKANELMAHSYSHLFNIPTTGLRFFTVYGPWGRPDMALFLFTKSILENKPINVFNNGDMIRDFTFVDDIVESIVRLIEKPPIPNYSWNSANPHPSTSSAPYKIFNIGNSSPVQLMEYIHQIEQTLGKKANINYMGMQPGDVPKTHADTESLVDWIKYRPSTTIKDGIEQFISWYSSYYTKI